MNNGNHNRLKFRKYALSGKSIRYMNELGILDEVSKLEGAVINRITFGSPSHKQFDINLLGSQNKTHIKKGFVTFVKKALPLTIITAFIYLFFLYFLNFHYHLNESIYKVIFIGLASLTFPHILLEYLVEKNK